MYRWTMISVYIRRESWIGGSYGTGIMQLVFHSHVTFSIGLVDSFDGRISGDTNHFRSVGLVNAAKTVNYMKIIVSMWENIVISKEMSMII